jgi:hypothetical protein
MSPHLTTAESLVLEVLVAHKLLGAPHSTLDRCLWVKPQLETLREHGLVTWTFDEDANFRVTSTEQLMSAPEAIMIAARLTQDVRAASTPGALA